MKNNSVQQSKRISKDQIKQVADKVVQHLTQQRQQREKQIPKVLLQPQHVENCELLLNRLQLLGKMKKRSVVAEIGVDEGKFSQLIHKIVKPQKFHLIDTWGSDRFHDGKFEAVKAYFAEEMEEDIVQIHKAMLQKLFMNLRMNTLIGSTLIQIIRMKPLGMSSSYMLPK
jgi:hypothetical protein